MPSPPASAWCTSTSCWPTTSPLLENIILGAEPRCSGGAHRLRQGQAARSPSSARRYGLDVNPDDLVETSSVGERQRVEIIKVLYRGAKILILDEPTAVLVPQEVEELFRNASRARRPTASTIIFIAHKLDEVLAIADTITVMRRARRWRR